MKEIIDYAMPLMKLEKLNRQMHDMCLAGDYLGACELTQHVLVEARILAASLALMHEKNIKLNSERALVAMTQDAKMLGLDY